MQWLKACSPSKAASQDFMSIASNLRAWPLQSSHPQKTAQDTLVLSSPVQNGQDISGLRGTHHTRDFLPVTQQN